MIKLIAKPLTFLKAMWVLAFPMFSGSAAVRDSHAVGRWPVRLLLVGVILGLLFLINVATPIGLLNRLNSSPTAPWLDRFWLPVSALCLYFMLWLGWGVYRVLSLDIEPVSSEFPDIDRAWSQAMEELNRADIPLDQVPLFLVLGWPSGSEEDLFHAAGLKGAPLQQVPNDPGEPLHVTANRDGIWLTCPGASLLGQVKSAGAGCTQGSSEETLSTLTDEPADPFKTMEMGAGGVETLQVEDFRDTFKRVQQGYQRGVDGEGGVPEPAPIQLKTIRRHTDVSFPALVQVRKSYNLRVQLVPAEETLESGEVRQRPRPHEHDTTLDLQVPVPACPDQTSPPIKLTISVAAENFDLEGQNRAEIIVPMTGKSPAVSFGLRALEVGPGRIMVDFSQEGRPVGSVDLTPEVVADLAAVRPSSGLAPTSDELSLSLGLGSAPTPPDVVLKVFEHRLAGHPGRLQFVLSSGHPALADLPVLDGDLGTLDLRTDVASWVEGQLRTVGALAVDAEIAAEDAARTLAGVGFNLYQHLLPPAVQELSWTLRRRGVKTLMILSDDPHIPWELIKPFRADPVTAAIISEDDFWGESYALAHWLRGRPPVPRLSITRVLGVAVASAGPAPGSIQRSESRSPGSQTATTRDMVRIETTSTRTDTPAESAVTGPVQPQPAALGGRPGQDVGVAVLASIHGIEGFWSGSGPLAAGDEELGLLRALEALGARVDRLPALRRDLRKAFEEGSFDLLHLVSHGSFGGAADGDATAVFLDDGVFTAAELSPLMAGALRRKAPLVIFNTCHCGRLGFSLTRLGSWGAHLVQLGCGGFVGALWPVSDRAALAFAQAFYGQLARGCPLGEAVRLARLRVREQYPGDPTWLAYCCFADPMAQVLLRPAQ
jgi:hypothetical protein